MPNRREFSIDLKHKVNNNIRGQLLLSKQNGLRGVLGSTTRRRHFEVNFSKITFTTPIL